MLAEAATTAAILLRAVCQLLPELLGRGPVAAHAAELYRPSSYQNQLQVATSPSPGASSAGAREGALEASARLLSHLAYSNQAKESRKHHGHSKSADQHRALDVWEVNEDAEYGEAGVSGAREALRSERAVPKKVAA